MLFKHPLLALSMSALISSPFFIAATVQPANAADHVFKCLSNPGAQETATVVFHPRLFGVDGNEGDGDVFTDDFEHRFYYSVAVTAYDESKPGWTGPEICRFEGKFAKDWDMPNIRLEFMEVGLNDIVIVKNVPRQSQAHVHFAVYEDDSGLWDWADFDPDPKTSGDIDLNVFVSQMKGWTMVGQRQGKYDLGLNQAKRLVGDGNSNAAEYFRAFLEFVVNVHPDNWSTGPLFPNVPGTAIPGQIVPPATPTPNNNPQCRDYALKAVEQNQEQLGLGCGFQPPVWSNDHQMHFDWCAHGNNVATAAAETQKRVAALAACKSTKTGSSTPPPASPPGGDACALYANEALKIAAKASALGCGFTGPRWLQDYNAHLAFCQSNPNPVLLLAEHAMRDSSYQACAAQAAPTASAGAADWVFPDSHIRPLVASEVNGLSKNTLWQARNEIFARKGLIFSSAKAKAFFGSKPWYQGLYGSVTLNPVEAANVALIKSYE